ncbi:MAG: YbdD/YjiX family protein [Gemmatimonadaceae bacterium]
MTAQAAATALVSRIRVAGRMIRRIIGAPDYDAYVAHQRRHHPGCSTLTEREFIQQRLDDRYSRPGSRCC